MQPQFRPGAARDTGIDERDHRFELLRRNPMPIFNQGYTTSHFAQLTAGERDGCSLARDGKVHAHAVRLDGTNPRCLSARLHEKR
ncbi:hypothetical protein D3C83_102510 [compost metagenome]